MRHTLAGLVVASSVLAACSGNDETGSTTIPTTTPTTASATNSTATSTTTSDTNSTTSTTTSTAASTTNSTTMSTTAPTAVPLDLSLGPVAAPVRNPLAARSIYFVMLDRFENGDRSNDTADVEGGPLEHGFLPTDRAFHHGGDLAGLTARLPYLADLGIGAVWMTSPFTNRWVQGNGTIEGSSSSYHGYWNVDFDRIDPHLGTEDEMQAFIALAHELDIAVYLDIVVNHTGDVITYAEDTFVYRGSRNAPYLDADGNEFDPTEFAGTDEFPPLDPAVSFPYTPVFADPADASAKSPDWLDDVTLYHNRGNSLFQGESDTWGDFFGLDDLMTEHPRVVDGMIELYGGIIERYDVDGFRVDTMKHVNPEFWAEFAPAIRARAAELGKPDFFVFGEVFNRDPIVQSSYTNLGVSSTLDFIVDDALRGYVAAGGDGQYVAQAFDQDDWFTDADNNASMQVTFLGNHDEGRLGHFVDVSNSGATDDELLDRARLGHDLLFLTRGPPVVYYGDEQGFTGTGGDQLARQDMFPSVTPEYVDDDNIGTDATPADDNFDRDHPLYRRIAQLNGLRREHPVFATGAQIVHPTTGPVLAFSRLDRDERVEYLVITNSSATSTGTASFAALTPGATFSTVLGFAPRTESAADGAFTIDVPPLGTIVLRADRPLPVDEAEPDVSLTRPGDGAVIPTPRYRLQAELADDRFAEVTFAAAVDGADPVVVGVDDAPPYRVYWNNAGLPAGASVELIATVDDGSGRLRSDVVGVTLGARS